jgi:hypothetical protein
MSDLDENEQGGPKDQPKDAPARDWCRIHVLLRFWEELDD